MSIKQKRNSYRVHYPVQESPVFYTKKGIFPIIDLSEGGMQFRGNEEDFYETERFTGKITFSENYVVTFEAMVLRINKNRISVCFKKDIPYKKLIEEQLRLRKKYPVV